MSIATFSDELKIFKEDDYSLSASVCIYQKAGSYGRITWSGDAKWITVASVKNEDEHLPVFKYKDNQLIPMKHINLTNIRSTSFFNWTNKNMAVGTEIGDIYVWDLKEKKVSLKVDTELKHSVDHISVNSDDMYLASGSLISNKVCVHSLKTNKVVNTFVIPLSHHASCLCFCMPNKSYLGASSYEGAVCVWDIARSEVVFKSVNSQCGACTGISFSPINFYVIATVSLNKTLKIHDLREKTSVYDINMGEAMYCVDMVSNGDKIIVGTESGTVVLHDLRANKTLQTIKAHESPVLSVKMQTKKIQKSYKEVEMNTPDLVEAQSKTLDISVMDVFSPIYKVSADKSNSLTKSVSFHSTPKIIDNYTDSGTAYDSFMRKVLTPKNEKIMVSTPVEQESCSCKRTEFSDGISMLKTVKKEHRDMDESIIHKAAGDGHYFQQTLSDSGLLNFLTEMKTAHMEQQKLLKELSCQISSIENQLQEMKLENESKHQTFQDNFENLTDILINGIKQEIYSGNCDGKLEHICQRHLINNVSNLITEKSDKVINEINHYVQKINLIHKLLSDIKK